MLRNMGEKVSAHMQEIAFNTSRRTLRAALLPLLNINADNKKVVGIHLALLFHVVFLWL